MARELTDEQYDALEERWVKGLKWLGDHIDPQGAYYLWVKAGTLSTSIRNKPPEVVEAYRAWREAWELWLRLDRALEAADKQRASA